MQGPQSPSPSRVSELLHRLDLNDREQAEELLSLVYGELHRLAAAQLARERPDITLSPTELVHEAYLRLVRGAPISWESRTHFFGIAARAMRQVLVDAARRRRADRRGAGADRVTLPTDVPSDPPDIFDVLDLHQALARLGAEDPSLERLVELRFFGGLTLDEAADAIGVSRRKAANDWAAARLWLRRALSGA